MPANLPPQYYEAEKNFRLARTPQEKIMALEEMLAIMPKHKGTDHLRAELRRRIAKLSEAADKKMATQRTSTMILKQGAAQLAVIGPPNVGKSQLVTSITNASPTVAEYPFTTQNAIPGMMKYENIQIQLLDTPPLVAGSIDFWLPHMFIRADALLVVVDLSNEPIVQIEAATAELERMGIKLAKAPLPESPGIRLKKALIVANKLDLTNARSNYLTLQNRYKEQLPVIAISAKEATGLEELKSEIYRMLDIIRVYTKTPGNKPEFNDPIILERGSTLVDAATSVHKDFASRLKYARIWGSGKHDGVMAKRDHTLEDGDIIELHI